MKLLLHDSNGAWRPISTLFLRLFCWLLKPVILEILDDEQWDGKHLMDWFQQVDSNESNIDDITGRFETELGELDSRVVDLEEARPIEDLIA
jgi:hypothetical protein